MPIGPPATTLTTCLTADSSSGRITTHGCLAPNDVTTSSMARSSWYIVTRGFARAIGPLMLFVLGSCAPSEVDPTSTTTSQSGIEQRAAAAFRLCMQASGIQVRSIDFSIEGRELLDWEGDWDGQGTIEGDNIHNACIRRLIDELDLETDYP